MILIFHLTFHVNLIILSSSFFNWVLILCGYMFHLCSTVAGWQRLRRKRRYSIINHLIILTKLASTSNPMPQFWSWSVSGIEKEFSHSQCQEIICVLCFFSSEYHFKVPPLSGIRMGRGIGILCISSSIIRRRWYHLYTPPPRKWKRYSAIW